MVEKRTLLVAGARGAGKTRVAVGLVEQLRARGLVAAGLKPIETGCAHGEDHDLVALDGERLSAVCPWVPKLVVAPYRFARAGSALEAAAAAGIELRIADLVDAIGAGHRYADLVVAELPGAPDEPIAVDGDARALAERLGAPLLVVTDGRVELSALEPAIEALLAEP